MNIVKNIYTEGTLNLNHFPPIPSPKEWEPECMSFIFSGNNPNDLQIIWNFGFSSFSERIYIHNLKIQPEIDQKLLSSALDDFTASMMLVYPTLKGLCIPKYLFTNQKELFEKKGFSPSNPNVSDPMYIVDFTDYNWD